MAREKLSIDPLALAGVCLTLVTMTAGATWFFISRSEKSENVLLKEQVQFVERQLQIQKQDSQEKSDVLRRINATTKNATVKKLVETVCERKYRYHRGARVGHQRSSDYTGHTDKNRI